MPREGAMILGDYAPDVSVLNFACRKCARRGRYRMSTLLTIYGRDMKLPYLVAEISADCAKRQLPHVAILDLCGAYIVENPETAGR